MTCCQQAVLALDVVVLGVLLSWVCCCTGCAVVLVCCTGWRQCMLLGLANRVLDRTAGCEACSPCCACGSARVLFSVSCIPYMLLPHMFVLGMV